MAGVSGVAVAAATAGGLLIYAGFRGVSPLHAFRDVSTGTPPPVSTVGATFPTGGGGPAASSSSAGTALLAEMQRIGEGRSYSQLRRTGPNSYDCSGLVWRAGQNLGVWGGAFPSAFSTATFIVSTRKAGLAPRRVGDTIQPGDIVWWHGHMGVAIDSQTIYAARSSRARPQIGRSSIKGVDGQHGAHSVFYFTGAAK